MRPYLSLLVAAGTLGLSLCAFPLTAQTTLQDLDAEKARLQNQIQKIEEQQAQQKLKQQNEDLQRQIDTLKQNNKKIRAAVNKTLSNFYAIVLNLNDSQTRISLKRLRIIKDENGVDKLDYIFINGAINVKQDTPIIFIVQGINPFRNSMKLTASPQERFLSSQGLFVNNLIKISQDTFRDTNTVRTMTDEIQQIKASQLSALPAVPDPQDTKSTIQTVIDLHTAATRLLIAARVDERLLKRLDASDPQSVAVLKIDAVQEAEGALAFSGAVNLPPPLPVQPPAHVKGPDGKPVLPLSQDRELDAGTVDIAAVSSGLTTLGDYLLADVDRAYQKLNSDMQADKNKPDVSAALALYHQIEGKRADIRAKFTNAAKLVSLILRASDKVAFGPFLQYGDTLRFSVEVTRTSDNEIVYKKDNVVYIQASHGFKINFSPGLAFTGLLDQSYTVATTNPSTGQGYTLPNSTTPAVVIHRDSQDQFTTAFAGFMHLYPQFPEWFAQPALTLGVGFRTANTAPTYLIGGSLFFGRERRIVFTGGIAYGSVTRLKGLPVEQPIATSVLDQIAPTNASGRTLPTSTVYRSSWFLGLSYNF